MRTNANETNIAQNPRKIKRYTNELEKQLLIDNIQMAVEVYGKDFLRKYFKSRKPKNAYNQN